VNVEKHCENPAREPETELVRRICRAVIHRVRLEHPHARRAELLAHLQKASPFREASEELQAVWEDEVEASLLDVPEDQPPGVQ
jgi:hypothetical protein